MTHFIFEVYIGTKISGTSVYMVNHKGRLVYPTVCDTVNFKLRLKDRPLKMLSCEKHRV